MFYKIYLIKMINILVVNFTGKYWQTKLYSCLIKPYLNWTFKKVQYQTNVGGFRSSFYICFIYLCIHLCVYVIKVTSENTNIYKWKNPRISHHDNEETLRNAPECIRHTGAVLMKVLWLSWRSLWTLGFLVSPTHSCIYCWSTGVVWAT